MKSVFRVLLLSVISMVVTVSTNAHEQCKIDPSATNTACYTERGCLKLFKSKDAACLIATSVIVDMQCYAQDCGWSMEWSVENSPHPLQLEKMVEHTQHLAVVHPTYAYASCEVSQGDKHEQTIICTLNEFIWPQIF